MIGEFDFIRNLRRRTANPKKRQSPVKVGIGDDCAVVSQNSKTDLVVTADLLVEDIDFRLEWTRAEFIGHKALAVSLSDVAAMGAKPLWALVSIGVPEKIWKTDFVEKFYAGWFGLAKKFEVELIGGDVSRTPDKIAIDSIAAGETKKNRAILRSGAQPGDLIYVTGKLGGAPAGLRLLESGLRFEKEAGARKNLIRRQLSPTPRVEIGLKLAEKKLAAAMLDLSDGLSSDLSHLCRASRVGAQIFAEKLPLEKSLQTVLKQGEDETLFAVNGGEDFELLFTARPKDKNKLEKLFGEKITRIGHITDETEKIELRLGSKFISLKPEGFRHF